MRIDAKLADPVN